MDTVVYLFIVIFGAIIGSFLNVVIFRYNTGRSITTGRSACMSCARQLSWYNMIPLLSFTIQRGRCSSCFSKISKQYFMVELLMALLVVALYAKYGLSLLLLFFISIFSILLVIAVYDWRHKIIPDGLSYSLIFLTFLRLIYLYTNGSPLEAISGFKSGVLAFLFLGSFWLVSNGSWMGLGDAKLALSLGFMNSLCFGITSTIFAFWIGAVVGVFVNYFVKKIKEVPFAPFLIIGFTLVFFLNFNLFYYLGDAFCLANIF